MGKFSFSFYPCRNEKLGSYVPSQPVLCQVRAFILLSQSSLFGLFFFLFSPFLSLFEYSKTPSALLFFPVVPCRCPSFPFPSSNSCPISDSYPGSLSRSLLLYPSLCRVQLHGFAVVAERWERSLPSPGMSLSGARYLLGNLTFVFCFPQDHLCFPST